MHLREQLLNEWNNGEGTLPHHPKRSDYSFETAQNGPSIAVVGFLKISTQAVVRIGTW